MNVRKDDFEMGKYALADGEDFAVRGLLKVRLESAGQQ
jgi:hypothetical protein